MAQKISINLDMDGTIANLYSCPDWLAKLRAYDPTPYEVAEVMHNMSLLSRYLNRAQAKGCEINIISWLSKETTADYDQKVIQAKLAWLRKRLPSVHFDNIHIVAYGTPKSQFIDRDNLNILFDDESKNRLEWMQSSSLHFAYPPNTMFDILKIL